MKLRDRKNLGMNEAVGSDSLARPGENAFFPAAVENREARVFRNIRGIIFDFDGTLFENAMFPVRLVFASLPDALRIWRERLLRKRFEGRDFSTPEKYYRAFFGILGKACRRTPQFMKNWYFKTYMPRMVRILRKYFKLRPGVNQLFERLDYPAGSVQGLSADFPAFAVYSDYPFLRERLQALGAFISPKLRLYGPEHFGAQKPAARPFRCIAQDMGLRPDEILVIGDRQDTDGRGAFNAGMRFLCLKTGRRRYLNKLDPYSNYPHAGKPHTGPILPMYSASWDELKDLYKKRYGEKEGRG